MTKYKIRYFLIFTLVLCVDASAATYYVSNKGNDSNDGRSANSPFQSVQKLNALMYSLKPGDDILFERGSIFYGTIIINASGIEGNTITFGAYGIGAKPVISGSVPVNNWSVYKGNIYKASVADEVKDLFVNNERMILARYPNTEYLRIDKPFTEPNKGFTDTELNQAEGYWNGSNVRIRTENWTYEHTVIDNFKNGSVSFSKPTYYPAKSGWGYYLDNNLNLLDIEGEWYFDKNIKSENLYFYPPKGVEPNETDIRTTIYDYGFISYIELSNVTVRSLEFRDQFLCGIYLGKIKSNIRIENCTFTSQSQIGISIPGDPENLLINNCKFYNIAGKAMYILNAKNSVISQNIIRNTGMISGYGMPADAFNMSAIFVHGDNNKITGNNIDSTGHNGINCLGARSTIEKNVIKNTLLLLNDGGAIKCYGEVSNNSHWRNNFIINVTGNMESTNKQGNQIIALGIYLDELANNTTISKNTITGCGSAAMGTNAGFENNFENNLCYNNGIGMTFYQNNIPFRDNNFENNILFGITEDQFAILNQSASGSKIPGRFNNNYYFNPLNHNMFRIREGNVIQDYSFEKWKQFVQSDNNSKQFINKDASYSKLFVNMSDESTTISLNSRFIYKDLDLGKVSGSINLLPWTSAILMTNKDVNNLPEIFIAGGPSPFNLMNNSNSSEVMWYNLIGNNLKAPVEILAPEGFKISLRDDRDFSNSLKVESVNGKLDRIIFIKFVAERDSERDEVIVNKSGDTVYEVKVNIR